MPNEHEEMNRFEVLNSVRRGNAIAKTLTRIGDGTFRFADALAVTAIRRGMGAAVDLAIETANERTDAATARVWIGRMVRQYRANGDNVGRTRTFYKATA